MKIQKLPPSVRSYIQSGIIITDAVQGVLELVYNALDANAIKIAVRVDLRKFLIQVVDNGDGITREDLDLIGDRYMTSKCHDVNELENIIPTYGYRGQALASLLDVSSKLKIETRCKKEKYSFVKVFVNGHPLPVAVCDKDRSSTGTTVTLEDFMYTMPVRRKRIDEIFDIQGIRIQLEHLAIVHHDVCFSIYDEDKDTVILQTHKKPDAILSFADLYGLLTPKYLIPVKAKSGNIEISGFISRENHNQSSLQLLFVNKRLIYKNDIHKLINKLISKYLEGNGRRKLMDDEVFSDKEHHVFLIQISCPYTFCEFLPNLRKTTVEFKNWNDVLKVVHKGVKEVLKLDDKEESKIEVDKKEKKKVYPVKLFKKREGEVNPEFGTSQLKTGVRGIPVKRKNNAYLRCSTPLPDVPEPKKKRIDLPRRNIEENMSSGQSESPIPNFSQKKIAEKPKKKLTKLEKKKKDVVFKKPEVPVKINDKSEECLLQEFQKWLKIKAKNDLKAFNFYKQFINFKREYGANFPDSSLSEAVESPFEGIKKVNPVNEINKKKFGGKDSDLEIIEETPKKFEEMDEKNSPFRISFKDNFPRPSQDISFLNEKYEQVMDVPKNILGFDFQLKTPQLKLPENVNRSFGVISPSISDSSWNNYIKLKNLRKEAQNLQPSQQEIMNNNESIYNSPYFDSFIRFNNISINLSSSIEMLSQDKQIQTTICNHEKLTCEEGVQVSMHRRDAMVQTDFNNLESEDEGFYSENLNKKQGGNQINSDMEKTVMFKSGDFLEINLSNKEIEEPKYVSSGKQEKDLPCDSEFFLTERYDFVPKGFSPNFLGSHPKNIPDLNSQEKNRIRSTIPIDDNFLDNVKWLNQDLGVNTKPQIPNQILDNMRQEAEEKMIYYEDEVLSAAVSKSSIKVHNLLNSYSFAKEYLLDIKVIGQLDKKFIVALMSITKNKKFHLLTLFDQHAVDERIQLEQLMKDYRTAEGLFKSIELEPPILCSLNESTVRVISHFQGKLQEYGIKISTVNSSSVSVLEVPVCLFDKGERDSKNKENKSLEHLIQNLLIDLGEELFQTRGIISTIPKVIRNVISSQACRSAVKFNQTLTLDEMEKMMKALANCDFPFQCAHGRPSIAPIIDVEDFKTSKSKIGKIDLQNMGNVNREKDNLGKKIVD